MGDLPFSGVIPANLLPFTPDLAIDEADYRRHLTWLADVPGVTAITVNGHAAEVSSLTRDERRRALTMALDEVGSRLPLISGIYTDSTLEAVELARDAKAEGASGLLIFPPSSPFRKYVTSYFRPPFWRNSRSSAEWLLRNAPIDLAWTYETLY